jgi:anti-anti-sigma factor
MPFSTLRRVTDRIRKLIAETEPASASATTPDRPNPRTMVEGRLCLQGATQLRQRLFGLFAAKHRQLALDLSSVRFMDGSALAVLVEFAQSCLQRGVALRLIEPSEQVWNTFSMYGMTEILIEFADFEAVELDGLLIVLEEDFLDSIRLPVVAAA